MRRRKMMPFEEALSTTAKCSLWPACACHENFVKFEKMLDPDAPPLSLERIEDIEIVLFYTAACVAVHCPDPVVKAYGQRQLDNLSARRLRIAQAEREARGQLDA